MVVGFTTTCAINAYHGSPSIVSSNPPLCRGAGWLNELGSWIT